MGAYFLGGFGEDGRGMNGLSKAVSAAAKSWAVGIPVSTCDSTCFCIMFYTFGFGVKKFSCFLIFEGNKLCSGTKQVFIISYRVLICLLLFCLHLCRLYP